MEIIITKPKTIFQKDRNKKKGTPFQIIFLKSHLTGQYHYRPSLYHRILKNQISKKRKKTLKIFQDFQGQNSLWNEINIQREEVFYYKNIEHLKDHYINKNHYKLPNIDQKFQNYYALCHIIKNTKSLRALNSNYIRNFFEKISEHEKIEIFNRIKNLRPEYLEKYKKILEVL